MRKKVSPCAEQLEKETKEGKRKPKTLLGGGHGETTYGREPPGKTQVVLKKGTISKSVAALLPIQWNSTTYRWKTMRIERGDPEIKGLRKPKNWRAKKESSNFKETARP